MQSLNWEENEDIVVPMKPKKISELEQQVMNIVWSLKKCSVRDVLTIIGKTKPVAYTTILTVLQRLYEKGLVVKKREGKAFLYKPKVSKELYSRSMAQGFLRKFINSFGDIGIASFAESIESLSTKEKEYLIELLDHHEKNK